MKNTISMGLGALLLLASAATAQVEASAPAKAPSFKALEATYELAKSEYDAKIKAVVASDAYRALLAEKDYDGLRELRSEIVRPDKEFYARFAKLAKTQVGTESEIKTLLWMMSHNRDKAENGATIEALAERHIKADFWGPQVRLVPFYLGAENGATVLKRLAKENTDLTIQLAARHELIKNVIRNKSATEEDKAEAQAELDEIVVKYPESLPALQVRAPKFVKSRLQIGMEAPEIIGEDLHGNDIKLSDYRGRVVVLDFWGDW